MVAGGDAAKRRNKTTGARATANSKTGDAPPHAAARSLAQPLRRSGPLQYLHSDNSAPRAAPSRRAHRPVARSQPRAAPWTCPSAISSLLLAFTRDLDVPRAILARRSPAVGVALARTVTRTPSLVARLHTSCRTCAWALWGAWGSVNKVRHSVPRSVVELSRCRVRMN